MHRKANAVTVALDQSPADPAADTNNNSTKKNEKYSLRQRQRRDSRHSAQNSSGSSSPELRGVREKPKSKAAPLSKYRRKTANARERTRMREINSAFESLRQCVPISMCGTAQACSPSNEKLTKITTLRLAMKYIRTLSECLSRSASSDSSVLVNNNSLSVNNNCKPDEEERKRKKKDLSPCLTPPMDDSPADLGLILESDGESLQLSEPCLSPLAQTMKPFGAADSLELGLFLESDSESLQLSEPCLSPLGPLDPFGDDWIHSGFSEHSALDIYLT
ncbi:helix-loop-helix protein delilah [Phlebotomus argentipes]|uniref:helix-loop-helix protein delilah n=1 Tax=Phlebotomus argentipes TaxID=94469 RepID=UPI0028932342|nr:helix-loop-helix protein delilah [Phlebotomus argentipes]